MVSRDAGEVFGQMRLRGHHLDRGPGEDSGAEVDERRIALHETEDQRAPPDDDGDADQQAQDDQQKAAVRGASHGEHVVEAHDRVGDHDGAERAPETLRCAELGGTLLRLLGEKQPVGDPYQQASAHE